MSSVKSTFSQRMIQIMDAIGINNEQIKAQIISGFDKYTDENKIKIIDNIGNKIQPLLKADNDLRRVLETGLRNYGVNDEVEEMKAKLAELQGLVILKKINENDCDEVIKSLVAAINNKITVVNDFLKNNLSDQKVQNVQIGGSLDELKYKSKYLKYKSKYLNLIKNYMY